MDLTAMGSNNMATAETMTNSNAVFLATKVRLLFLLKEEDGLRQSNQWMHYEYLRRKYLGKQST